MPSSASSQASSLSPRARPPFRADHVGSLLRPKELQEARAAWKSGAMSREALRAVEDRCIEAAIRRQQEIGLRAVTDGEYRRAYWHYDFVAGLDGVEIYEPEQKIQFKGNVPLPHALRVTGRIGWSKPVMIDDYRFVAGHAGNARGEADDPVTERRAFPRRPAGDRRRHLPRYGRLLRRSRRRLSRRGAAPSRRRAAATCSSTR